MLDLLVEPAAKMSAIASSPDGERIAHTPKTGNGWHLVMLLYIGSALQGAADSVTDYPVCVLLPSLLMASTATLWSVFDARRRNRPIVHIVQFLIFILWPIAVPLYLI